MNFEDEPYVRVYSRKTLTSKLLGWEGRVVLRQMVDEFDGAGVFEIRGDAAASISAITELPIEIVRVGLQRLIETETWVVTARAITWPTYEEAQNCRRSDRLRQRESRRARSHSFVTDVTGRHSSSQQVTLPPSAPSHPPILPPEEGERAGARKPPPQSQGEPTVFYTLKGWNAPKELEDEALMANISREYFRERIKRAQNKPIGGRTGVLDRADWVREQFKLWAIDERTEKARIARPANDAPPKETPEERAERIRKNNERLLAQCP